MVKIYTKTGDSGATSLFGGKRLSKNDARVEAYGTVDELNSLIGIALASLRHSRLDRESDPRRSLSRDSRIRGNDRSRGGDDKVKSAISNKLVRIQKELFALGGDLASPNDLKIKVPRINKPFITRLEQEIDSWDKNLPKLHNFILPGGSKTGAKLHLARSIARRVERAIATLSSKEKINRNTQIYINRLSDWLFVLARYVNKLEKQKENIWKGRK